MFAYCVEEQYPDTSDESDRITHSVWQFPNTHYIKFVHFHGWYDFNAGMDVLICCCGGAGSCNPPAGIVPESVVK
jgi:hypothetical protein